MKKLVNGILIDLTAQEITEKQAAETAWNNGALDRALENLRFNRNVFLNETDWMANSDVTMSDEWKTYRQELRDLTNGLTTVEAVENVTYPTKPGE